MAFYQRDMQKVLKRYAKFPVVALLGPRQSGKTTLSRHVFKNHVYINLDDFETRELFQNDLKGTLRKYENKHGIIIDEFQNIPELLSYIKVIVDEKNRPGYFVLTGSNNFLMNEAITQSLAGRVGLLTLLPFNLHELQENKLLKKGTPEEVIFKGGYPRLYSTSFKPRELYPSYVQTYVERDVRQLINVKNIRVFKKFLILCATRVGQLLNYSDLAAQCNISVPTVHEWLSILESSYIIFLLAPYFNNFSKRVTKSPKIYFFDTGLVCSLLKIQSAKSLAIDSMYGSLFECFIIADFYKQYFNQGLIPPLYFWRDGNGEVEVDCLIYQGTTLIPLEIKSSESYTQHFFNSLYKWNKIAEKSTKNNYVVYGGTMSFSGKEGTLVPWSEVGTLIKKIEK